MISSGQWCLIHDIHQDDPGHEYDYRVCEGNHREATVSEEVLAECGRYRAALEQISSLPFGMATVEGARQIARRALDRNET